MAVMRATAVAWSGAVAATLLLHTADAFVASTTGAGFVLWLRRIKQEGRGGDGLVVVHVWIVFQHTHTHIHTLYTQRERDRDRATAAPRCMLHAYVRHQSTPAVALLLLHRFQAEAIMRSAVY